MGSNRPALTSVVSTTHEGVETTFVHEGRLDGLWAYRDDTRRPAAARTHLIPSRRSPGLGELRARHGTREQARFFLHARDRTLDHLTLDWGQRVEVRVADSKLQLAR